MPVLRWSCAPDTEQAARIVGPKIRQLRESRGLTIRGLAERAGISKNTLLRLEQGAPIAEPAMHRVCDCLQTIFPNLMDTPEVESAAIKIYRDDPNAWRIAFRRRNAPARYRDFEAITSSAERHRLGSVNFVSGFVQAHSGLLAGGRLQAAVVELYGDQERPGFRHSGEEFVYCLSGQFRLTVGKEVHLLNAGDSAVFFSGKRHRYESALPLNSGEITRILMVWYEGSEEEASREHDDECEIEI